MAGVMAVIWGKREVEYFSDADWTAGIALIGLRKLVFGRNFEASGCRMMECAQRCGLKMVRLQDRSNITELVVVFFGPV